MSMSMFRTIIGPIVPLNTAINEDVPVPYQPAVEQAMMIKLGLTVEPGEANPLIPNQPVNPVNPQ